MHWEIELAWPVVTQSRPSLVFDSLNTWQAQANTSGNKNKIRNVTRATSCETESTQASALNKVPKSLISNYVFDHYY